MDQQSVHQNGNLEDKNKKIKVHDRVTGRQLVLVESVQWSGDIHGYGDCSVVRTMAPM